MLPLKACFKLSHGLWAISMTPISQMKTRSEGRAHPRTTARDPVRMWFAKTHKYPQEDTAVHISYSRAHRDPARHGKVWMHFKHTQASALFPSPHRAHHAATRDFPLPPPMLWLKTAPSEKQGQEEGTESKRNISLNPSGYIRKLEDSTVTRRRSLECSQRGL